jgi:hypothetical protein
MLTRLRGRFIMGIAPATTTMGIAPGTVTIMGIALGTVTIAVGSNDDCNSSRIVRDTDSGRIGSKCVGMPHWPSGAANEAKEG